GQTRGLPADPPGRRARRRRRCGAMAGQRRLLVHHRPGSGHRRGDPGRPAPGRLRRRLHRDCRRLARCNEPTTTPPKPTSRPPSAPAIRRTDMTDLTATERAARLEQLSAAGWTTDWFAEFWAKPDLTLVPSMMTDDVVGYWPGGRTVRGAQA